MLDIIFYFFCGIGLCIPILLLGEYLTLRRIIRKKIFYVGKHTYRVTKSF